MADEKTTGSLGDLLLREGLITDSQLSTSLQEQKETEKSLGRVLVEKGLITERVRMRLLQELLGYEIVQVNPQRVDRQVFDYIPKSVAIKHHLAPIRLDFDTLVVVMEDPTDVTILDHLKTLTGLKVRPAIAGFEEIQAVLAAYPEETEVLEAARPTPLWARILQDILLFGLLAVPIFGFFLYVPTNPELTSRFAERGARIDVFIFTLIGYGIYAVVVYEIWCLLFPRRKRAAEFIRPPSNHLP
jgi:hypothetical protein